MNTYCYLPFDSSHPLNVKTALVKGECRRLLKTCARESDYNMQIDFFTRKLENRGYPIDFVRNICNEYAWCDKQRICGQKTARGNKPRVVPLKVPFSEAVESMKLDRVLQGMWTTTCANSLDLKPVLCYTSQPNLFRMRFSRFT